MNSTAVTKRRAGRTGPRKLSLLEVAQRDQHAFADHIRRYGKPIKQNRKSIGAPPGFMGASQKAVWRQIVDGAPPNLLRRGDRDNLTVLVTATDLYLRMTRRVAKLAADELPDPVLVQQLRLVGAEVGRATRVLGLNPPERARIGLPNDGEDELEEKQGWSGLSALPKAA
jgi:hypothetical protein